MGIQQRRLRLILAYSLLLLPTIVMEAKKATDANANSPLDWVPATQASRREYDRFTRMFGSGDVVVISWNGCRTDLPQLDQLAHHLRTDPAWFNETSWLFDGVVTGRELVRQLEQAGISTDEARQRLRGVMVGPDGFTTCAVIGFTKEGLARRSELVPEIQRTIERQCGVPRNQQRMAGPVIDGLSVDLASQSTLQRLAVPSSLVVLFVAFACLRSWKATLIVFVVSVYCQAVTLALISLCGDTMSALLVVLPPLVQVLALASGVHLVNYYRDVSRTTGLGSPYDERPGPSSQASSYDGRPRPSPLNSTDEDVHRTEILGDVHRTGMRSSGEGPEGAVEFSEAARRTWKLGTLPCLLSAGTTAVGMASLMVSQLTPVRAFGLYATVGVMLTAGVVLALVPMLLAASRMPLNSRFTQLATGSIRTVQDRWSLLVRSLSRVHAPVIILLTVVMLTAGAGLFKLKTSVRIETLFPQGSRILADYHWLETHVAPLVPIEIIVEFQDSSKLSPSTRLELVRRLEARLKVNHCVGGTMSATTFLPAMPLWQNNTSGTEVLTNQLRDRIITAAEPILLDLRLAARSRGAQSWRIRALVSSTANIDYAAALDDIHRDLQSSLVDEQGTSLPGVTLRATGIMPLVHDIQRRLMFDLKNSFLVAFLIITVVMTVVQGSVAAGLLAMIPNVFPTIILFGVFGWSEMPVDIGSVMTASVALGVAVDDTIHFLTHFQRCLATGANRRTAVLEAYRHCGRAMLQTSLICALGMSVFALSEFLPTARFAWMMVGLFGAAIVGDLIFLPAILLGPLGRVFNAQVSRHEGQASNAASIDNPGPKPSITHGPSPHISLRRSRTNRTVGEDMLP